MNNLSLSSEDFKGSPIYKGIYGTEIEKSEQIKGAEKEKKQPTVEDIHKDEVKQKELQGQHEAKMDKQKGYDKLSKDEQRAIRTLLNVQDQSTKDKVQFVMDHFGVSRLGAINILADATKHMGEDEDVEKVEKSIVDELEKGKTKLQVGTHNLHGDTKQSDNSWKYIRKGERTMHEKAISSPSDNLSLSTKDFRGTSVQKAMSGVPELSTERLWKGEQDELQKAEGSRGGHVIGHTKSGKPIYETANHPGHRDFTPVEHSEAAKLHNHLKNEDSEHRMEHHTNQASEHTDMAEEKRDTSKISIGKKTFHLTSTGEGQMKYHDGEGTEYHSKPDEKTMDFHKRVKEAIHSDFKHLEKSEDSAKQEKVHKVMKEYKEGTLKSSSGEKVTDRKQAIAIAMSESKLSKAEDVENMIKEHERLVQVLDSPSHEDDKKEAKIQKKELKEYKEELKKGFEGLGL